MLGILTTRALAVATTGEIAENATARRSFAPCSRAWRPNTPARGQLQYFAARGDFASLRRLC
ncbi:MAG: hypothetical protein KF683_18175 [Rubrivivax sp.]|nr:hypothetical protein [Rubrivivax sp.]